MKIVLLFGALVALLCGCNNAQTTQTKGLYFLKAQNGFEEVNTKIVLR